MKKKILSVGIIIISLISLVILTGCGIDVDNQTEIGSINSKEENNSLPEDFYRIYGFKEGLAKISKFDETITERSGYMDKKGNMVIDNQYRYSGKFSEGLAYVSKDGDLYGYIDKNGNLVIDYQFELAGCFSDGLAAVEKNGKYGYIDKNGNVVIDYQFETAGTFSDGLAAVGKKNGMYYKYGYINKDGALVIDYKYDVITDFVDGLAGVRESIAVAVGEYIDKSENTVIGEIRNETPSGFSEGLTVVKNDEQKYGYIDKTGKTVIDYLYDSALNFSEGLAVVKNNDKYGYIDKTGKIVIDYIYDQAESFSEELALVKKDGKYEYIDKTGKVILSQK